VSVPGDVTRPGTPGVAFIVIAYNAEGTIRACIDSILAQGLPGEVILVDNGSTDGTISCVGGRPVTVVHEAKRCRGAARNRGLDAARADYIAFVDADVELPGDWGRRALDLLGRHPDVAAVGGPGRTPDGSWVSRALDALQYGHRLEDRQEYVVSLATMDVLYRAQSVRGLRFADLWAAEDPEFNFRLVERGHKLLWSRDLWVVHHHSTKLGELLRKAFAYGMWFLAPYWRHPGRLNPGVLARVAYVPGALILACVSWFRSAVFWALPFWILLPFIAYAGVALRQRKSLGAGGAARFVFVHGLRQCAQMAGIWAGIVRGTWRAFGPGERNL
jgi:glycosyltransferase involved in cell wall biosynthesis